MQQIVRKPSGYWYRKGHYTRGSIGQFGNDDLYESDRKYRLTASLFRRVIKTSNPLSQYFPILLGTKVIFTAATEYGIAKEIVAIQRFEDKKNLKIIKYGLRADLQYGFLDASPDVSLKMTRF